MKGYIEEHESIRRLQMKPARCLMSTKKSAISAADWQRAKNTCTNNNRAKADSHKRLIRPPARSVYRRFTENEYKNKPVRSIVNNIRLYQLV